MKKIFYTWYMRWRLLGFSRVLFWGDKVQQRFSVLGKWLLVALIVTMIFGVNTKQSMIYQMFAVLLALLLVALLVNIVLSIKQRNTFTVLRRLPPFATVNIPFSYHVQLKNKGNYDVFGLRVVERRITIMPSVDQFLVAREPLEEKRNWYDRKTGFYRFVWLQQWLRGAEFSYQIIAHLEAKQKIEVEIRVTPVRRGLIHFSHLRLALAEPLGVLYRFEEYKQPQSLLVLPKRYIIPQHLSLMGGRKYQQGGGTQVSSVGDSNEFNRLREYRAGDSPRHIHWASLAKSEKPLVKEYQDEHFNRQALVLDSFGGDTRSNIFEEAISVAAGFTATVETGDSLLDLMFVCEANEQGMKQLTVGRALANSKQMLQTLAVLQLSKQDEFQQLASTVMRQIGSFSAVVLILLIWNDERRDFVHQLLAQGIVLRVFLVVNSVVALELPDIAGLERNMHILTVGSVQQDLDMIDDL